MLFSNLTVGEMRVLRVLIVVGAIWVAALRRAQTRWGETRLAWVAVPLSVLVVSLAFALLDHASPAVWTLFFILPLICALFYGERWAYLSGLLSALGYLGVEALNGTLPVQPGEALLDVGALVLFAPLAGRLAARERRQRLTLAQLHTETDRRARRLAVVNEFAATLNRDLDLPTLLADAQRLAVELLRLERAWILLMDETAGEFTLAADHNLPPALAADDKREMRWKPCLCQRMLLAGELTEAVNIVPCERFKRVGITAFHASVPLKSGDRVLGLLNVVLPSGEPLAPEDLQTLSAMGAQFGVAPANCVALEDSATGIIAAKAAEMRAIAVPNQFTAHQDLSRADARVGSLEPVLGFLFPRV